MARARYFAVRQSTYGELCLQDLKVVIVGDGMTGKSHLVLNTFVKNDFIDENSIILLIEPVLTEEHVSLTHTVVDGQLVQLHLWHPPGLLTII